MSDQDDFSKRFADWLSEHCDTIHLGLWKYYEEEGMKSINKTTAELLKIFKDEMDKKG